MAAEDDQALIRWLEQLHACVDCVYWTLREKHLTLETILDPAGSLRGVPRAIRAFLDVLADRAAQSTDCVRSVSGEIISRHLRDCLKGAFRLILKLLRGARSDRRLSIVWGEGHATGRLSVVRAALFAVLLPGKLCFDSSEADACARIRSLGCEIVDELYQRENALVLPPLRSILSEAKANLCERLVEAAGTDALETLALIEGCLALHRVGRDVQGQLLQDSLPRLTSRELADKLTHQAAHAPMSLGPLQRQVMSKAVDLALTLGLPPQRIFQLISDATPVPNRSLELLQEVLRAPAFVEQRFDSLNRHIFSDGIISAFRSFAHAAASPGGGAAACSSERLWVAMADIIFGDGRWDTRYAALHWLVVPLAHAVKAQTLVDLLQSYMPRVASILDRCKNTAQSPLPRDTLELNSELVRRVAAFEFCAVLIARLGKQGRKELNVDGALGRAAGRNEDVFRLLAPAAGNTAKKNQSTVREEDADPNSRVTSALYMELRAAAYSALIEAVVPTQDDAGTIAKVLFKWEDLWENVVDHSKLFSLKAETDFPQTSARAQLALHAPARSRPQTGSAVSYLPSQALLASSLGQTQISQDVDARSSNNSTTRDDAQRSDRSGKVDFMAPSTLFSTSQSVVRNSQCFTQSQSNLPFIDEQDEDESITVGKTAVNNFNEEPDDFELDELNCHPLMAILMRCIRKLHSRKLGGSDYKNGGMPYWLSSLHAKMIDAQSANTSHSQLNARLLIAKLIFNLRHHSEEGAPDAAEVRLKRKQLLEGGKTIEAISRQLKHKCSSPHRIALEELREAARRVAATLKLLTALSPLRPLTK
ncbi:hypothetical protein AB1Y20_001180 [Prymnesium parvum]|uniref:DNA-dependent protein kinase catalytic subunit CC3 domain-containing protein n=1 Tax=Prymnesium parvum TaxID=97485 RepID=A0AB34K711_PRYPA